MSGTRVEVRDLTKRFGEVEAVGELTFTAEPGQVTGFLGPNGSGKTTTMRAMLGLVRPTSGSVTIGGVPYAELPCPARTVGAVLGDAGFHPGRTARSHLRVYGDMIGVSAGEVDDVIGRLEMSSYAGRVTRGFSTGMRQRLNLATALLGDPGVLLLDEPGNGLDPEGIAWLRGFLKGLAGEGRTVLVSSHVLGEVEQMADRVVVIRRGRLVATGTLAELAGEARPAAVVRSPEAERLAGLLGTRPGVEVARPDRETAVVHGLTPAEVAELAAAHGVPVHGLEPAGSGLERAFLDLTADHAGDSR